MNHIGKRVRWSVRKTALTLGIVMLFGGALGSSFVAGQVDQPRQDKEPAAAAAPQVTVRSPNDVVVGRRFTLEVIIANPGNQPIKGLEFVAEMDGSLEQDSKARAHTETIESISKDTPHIVRIFMTPTKKGPARIDIVISSKNGQKQQLQHVMPVFAADDAPPQAERPAGSSPLQVTISTPKDCFADQPNTFLIHLVNTDNQPTPDKMELVINYGTLSNPNFAAFGGNAFGGPGMGGLGGGRRGGQVANPTNPVRETKLVIATLAPNESRTVSVSLTPRRIGDFRVAVTAKDKMIGSAGVQAKFDPNMSIDSLVPMISTKMTPRLPTSLADIIEVGLEDRASKTMKADEAFEHIAHMMDKMNFANSKKVDQFVVALLDKRSDMKGMPMAMGDSCRLSPERSNQFVTELSQLRVAMAQSPNGAGLENRIASFAAGNKGNGKSKSARLAAMMQVLGPESVQMRQEMIKHVSTFNDLESTQALAKLAIFSEEESVRTSAINVLKGRQQKDYTDILLSGLNYPWPAVAQNAGDAIVKLNRTDLIPKLVETLERPDPRTPQSQNGKQIVREMVKINHLRNCMLCHPPRSADQNLNGGFGGGVAIDDAGVVEGKGGIQAVAVGNASVLAQVPIPNQPLPISPGNGGGYGSFSVPETLVRFDVTYLRQDFSVMLPVNDHQPWPQMQRFDFLVRTREVTSEEAKAYRDLLRPAGAGDLSPYQRAAVTALRALTGRDAEPTAPAWRKVLEG